MQWGVAELWLHRPALCVQGWPQEQQPRWVHWSPSESGGQHEECMQFTPCTISITFGSRNTIWGLLFFFFFCENKKSSLLFWKEMNQLPCSWLTTITTMTYFLLSLDKEAPKRSQGIIPAGPRKTCVCLCCMYDRTSLTPCGNQNWSPLLAW